MGVITFNNITSSSLGVEVETFPDYVAPEKEYQVTHIPGRNGDLVVDTKTFQNVPRSYEVSVATNGVPIDVVNAAVARFKSGSRIPIKSLVSQIVAVETGTGEKSPDNPYTISGFDSGVITRCGKNYIDESDIVQGGFNTVNGGDYANITRTRTQTHIAIPQGTYQVLNNEHWEYVVYVYDMNNEFIDAESIKTWQAYGTPFTVGANRKVRIGWRKPDNTTMTPDDIHNAVCTSTVNNYTFTFGQTVYGGHFDNKGNLVVTHGIKTFTGASSESWSEYPSYNGFYIAITDMNIGTRQNGLANRFVTTFDSSHTNNSCWFGVNSNRLFILECSGTTGATVAELKTWLANNNLTVIYPIEPITLAIESQDIPTLLGENNIFSNTGDVSVKVEPSFSTIINQVAEWLHSASGYARLEDTYDSDHYRIAYYSESVSFENLFNEAGKATLNFICKPQRYLKSGETPVVFTEEGTIQNGTRFSSSPVLKVTTDNTQGSVSIGNHTIAIKAGAGTDQITIDCELQDAWSGTTNKNSFIVLTDGEFPVIDPGTQTVTFDGGVQSVEVIPRWWTV